jgi:hypothetical protein
LIRPWLFPNLENRTSEQQVARADVASTVHQNNLYMNPVLYFWSTFLFLFALIIYCDIRFYILRDNSLSYRPYSWSRVQLAWWSLIILTAFISIMLRSGGIPVFNASTLVLLGISAGTSTVARAIDLSEKQGALNGAGERSHFLLDILSDSYTINIQRFQTVVFNAAFGIYFISYVLQHFDGDVNAVMPAIDTNNLILLGLSSATYAALKTTENKQDEQQRQAETEAVPVEDQPALG